jgi:cyclopropane-fatty-acyl-phospholipid synthase
MKQLIRLTEKGLIPDFLVRLGIQKLLRERLSGLSLDNCEKQLMLQDQFLAALNQSNIAEVPEKANQQHYEVPVNFFKKVLGPHLKYSCGYWDSTTSSLAVSESEALKRTCENADLLNSQEILELGCGWGSLSLWMAEHYPDSVITSVSNSATQKAFIEARVSERKFKNLKVLTSDMNGYEPNQSFDRIVSVEMFEHMRNWPKLFSKVSGWMKEDAKFLMHVFCHRMTPYFFEAFDDDDWMARYFFSGGIMPSDQLPYLVPSELKVEKHWRWDGTHYQKTSLTWLNQMDQAKEELFPVFKETYVRDSEIWWQRWRLFFLAVAEIFGFNNGQEWWVSHYQMIKHP